MKSIFRYYILAVLSVALFACSKDDINPLETKKQQLIGKKWMLSSTVSIDSNGVETDILSDLPEYQRDDYFLFNADSTYELNDNILRSSDTLSIVLDGGSWALTQGGTYLELYSNFWNSMYEPALIKELTNDRLFLERYYSSDRSTIRTRYISE